MSGTAGGTRRRVAGLLALSLVAAGAGTACSEDPDDRTAVNFTGQGTAVVEISGEGSMDYTVACESSEGGGEGELLVSGAGEGGAGLEIVVAADGDTARVGVNLGDGGPGILEAAEADVSVGDDVLVLEGTFVRADGGAEIGSGTVEVEGCTPTED